MGNKSKYGNVKTLAYLRKLYAREHPEPKKRLDEKRGKNGMYNHDWRAWRNGFNAWIRKIGA